MSTRSAVILTSWLLSALSVILAISVWLPSLQNLTSYNLFPLFGLIAFGLMWSHYVSGALRESQGVPKEALALHFQITSLVVLFCIITHPFLLELQLFLDGFGLPPLSPLAVYTSLVERLALLAGATALVCFLLYELYRFYADRPWWRYVEWANIAAMLLILWHGFTLGGELRTGWFQAVWLGYAITFIASVAYSEYNKKRSFLWNQRVVTKD